MADKFTAAVRSRVMSRIRGANTAPERAVRRLVHGMGYRFRLHGRHLPGTPDIVLPRHRCVIFVHGCFWHGHQCGRKPASKTRTAYWSAKILRNRERDRRTLRAIRRSGWRAMVVWECETLVIEKLKRRLLRFLSD
jgi:DNA mismatch endonuclease (patch repair protein)